MVATAALCGSASALAAERINPPVANPCTSGDGLLAAHHLDDAREFYKAQLNERHRLRCAELGLAAVAGEQRHAQRKLKEGDAALAQWERLRTEAGDARRGAESLVGKAAERKLDQADALEKSAAVQAALA